MSESACWTIGVAVVLVVVRRSNYGALCVLRNFSIIVSLDVIMGISLRTSHKKIAIMDEETYQWASSSEILIYSSL